jgi:hypothetical protein
LVIQKSNPHVSPGMRAKRAAIARLLSLAFCKHWSGNPEIGADAVAFAESLLIPCC